MKTIEEMAREAGWKDLRDFDSEMRDDIFMGRTVDLQAFAKLVEAPLRSDIEELLQENTLLRARNDRLEAQPPVAKPHEQEPVAWMYPDDYERMLTSETFCTVYSVEVGSATKGESTVALYTPPPQRTWVGLTDEEIAEAMEYWSSDERSAYGGAAAAEGEYFDVMDSWRYIEAQLKGKNT